MPPPGLDKLKHIVVLMMENRSFDHMLGALKATDPRIDGLDGTQFNPDTTGAAAPAQPLAQFQGQLDPDPDHHFPGVDLQIFNGDTTPNRVATMQGFVKSYFSQRKDVKHSRKIMYHFTPNKLPVLTTLATEFAVFNRWFASIPGPTLCNRAFAHYGSSFGHVGMEVFYPNTQFKSIYQRLDDAGKTAKIYYFDVKSSSLEVVNLLQHQPQFFGTFQQFLDDCGKSALPDYSFIEPNYSDHDSEDAGPFSPPTSTRTITSRGGTVHRGRLQRDSAERRAVGSTALLIVYDEHGGIYDHVPPPACTPDGFVAQPDATGTGKPFLFDRLGVRVPAVLVSRGSPRERSSEPVACSSTRRFLRPRQASSCSSLPIGHRARRRRKRSSTADTQTTCAPMRLNSTSADPWL